MKRILIAALIAGGVSGQAFAVNSATSGTIKFTGEVIAQTCAIKGEDPYTKTVTLPPVPASALASATETAGQTPFTIELTGCTVESGKNVYAKFTNPANVNTNANINTAGRLDNTASGGASNVEIQLLNKGDEVINLSNNTNAAGSAVELAVGVTEPVLEYKAQYYATDEATAGAVTSSVEFQLAYQ